MIKFENKTTKFENIITKFENIITKFSKNLKLSSAFVLFAIFSIGLCSCTDNKNITPYESQHFAMDTVITQRVHHPDGKLISEEVYNRIEQIEAKMTSLSTRKDSEVVKLNSKAGDGEFVDISDETMKLFEMAKLYNGKMAGNFDITVGPLVNLWAIGKPEQRVPAQAEINGVLGLIDDKSFEIDSVNKKARLLKKGMSIDLGGIAKGYAGDEAIKIYKKYNVESALINLGGNVVVHGKKIDGSLWKVGIQNPRQPRDKFIAYVKVSDMAVVTSGDYERYFEKDGIRYHHIFDPHTGYPAKAGLFSVTIVNNSSIVADILSKTVVMGLTEGLKFLERENIGGIFVTQNKEVYVTKNIQDIFTMDDETNEYKYVKNW